MLTIYQRKLEKLGLCLVRHQSVVILTWGVVLVLSCAGFVRWHESKLSPDDQFVLIDSQSRQDIKKASRYFPLLEARREEVILVPKTKNNVLDVECLREAAVVHSTVLNTAGFEPRCAKQLSFSAKQLTEKCVFLSPLELINSNMDLLKWLPFLLAKEWQKKLANSTVHFNFKETLSAFTLEDNDTRASAKAMRMVYFIQSPKNISEEKMTYDVEERLASRLSSLGLRMKCTSLSFLTSRMLDDVVADVLRPKSWPLAISAVVLLISGIILTKLSRRYFNCVNVFLVACSCVALALFCSLGVASLLGLPFSQTFWFLPFLLLGGTSTNALLVVRELENQLHSPSFELRLSGCLARMGLLILATTTFYLILFGVAMKASFPGLVHFFLVAFLSVFLTFLSILTLFPVLLTLDVKRIKSLILPVCVSGIEGVRRTTLYSVISHDHRNAKGTACDCIEGLTKLPGRILALILILVLVPVFSVLALKPGERFDTNISLHQGKKMRNFLQTRSNWFDKEADVSLVFFGGIDYSSNTSLLTEVISKASHDFGLSSNWINSLNTWARENQINCEVQGLLSCLLVLQKVAPRHPLWQDVTLQHNTSIRASQFHLHMKFAKDLSSNSKVLSSLREEMSAKDKAQMVAVSQEFIGLEDLMIFKQDFISTLYIATAAIFFGAFFLTFSPTISFILMSSFLLQVLEASAFMFLREVPFNQLSSPSFFVIVVVSFNYSVYVTQNFVVSCKKSSKEGALDAVASCFPAVVSGGALTVLGSFSLGFVFPHLWNLFQTVFPPLLLLGLVHAFLILPPLLSLTGYHLGFITSKLTELSSSEMQTQQQKFQLLKCPRAPAHPGISLIGISCKFPQAESKLQFWDMLVNGRCAVTESFPPNRPEELSNFHKLYNPKRFVNGRLVVMAGAYLENIRGFDAKFFGISPQEAHKMDPQQRILLQVVYEAIEDAGLRLEDLQRCRTGVFVGVMNLDYGSLSNDTSNYSNINQFTSTGITAPILANRISFCLNLTGPSLSVDTACSSSLTALKLACDSLHKRDCEVAVVCAPNIILDHAMQVCKASLYPLDINKLFRNPLSTVRN